MFTSGRVRDREREEVCVGTQGPTGDFSLTSHMKGSLGKKSRNENYVSNKNKDLSKKIKGS